MTVAVRRITDGEAPSRAARELLFETVKDRLSLEMSDADIVKDSFGKPYDKENRFFFSLSHSGELVAVLVADSPCGIDVQKARHVSDGILKKLGAKAPFCEGDVERTAYWTLAESYVKMTGKGIAGLSAVPRFSELKITSEFTEASSDSDELFKIKETDGYVLAVCIRVK